MCATGVEAYLGRTIAIGVMILTVSGIQFHHLIDVFIKKKNPLLMFYFLNIFRISPGLPNVTYFIRDVQILVETIWMNTNLTHNVKT